MENIIAFAASGSINADKALQYALKLCKGSKIHELWVIHAHNTHLARYGDFEHLASESCKSDFVEYIENSADDLACQTHDRIIELAKAQGITIRWHRLSGSPEQVIPPFVTRHRVTRLVIGKRQATPSFFYPAPQTAKILSLKCPCEVTLISNS